MDCAGTSAHPGGNNITRSKPSCRDCNPSFSQARREAGYSQGIQEFRVRWHRRGTTISAPGSDLRTRPVQTTYTFAIHAAPPDAALEAGAAAGQRRRGPTRAAAVCGLGRRAPLTPAKGSLEIRVRVGNDLKRP